MWADMLEQLELRNSEQRTCDWTNGRRNKVMPFASLRQNSQLSIEPGTLILHTGNCYTRQDCQVELTVDHILLLCSIMGLLFGYIFHCYLFTRAVFKLLKKLLFFKGDFFFCKIRVYVFTWTASFHSVF